MSRAQITSRGTWIRRIHDTWANTSGYRTGIPSSILDDPQVERAAFVLDDYRVIIVPMQALRTALAAAPRRYNGQVGPYNVDPYRGTIDGVSVPMEIRLLKKENAA